MSNQQTVFVVDDDESARRSVMAVAASMRLKCEAFASAEEFIEGADRTRRGCLVIDLRMPGMSGLELQEYLAEKGFDLPIILISAFADVGTTVSAMKRGAITVLEKPCASHILYTALLDALRLDRSRQEEHAVQDEIQARIETLTPSEHKVLALIMDASPNKSIASQLDVSLRTVELRRRSILTKIGAGSVVELVRLVIESRRKTKP